MTNRTLLISLDGISAYYLEEENLDVPNLRHLINSGTFVPRLRTTYPTSTWIIHNSVITGTHPAKHGVLGNWTIDRNSRTVMEHFGDLTDKEDVIGVPTLYDVAKAAGFTTASVMWPTTRGATSLDYCIPEFYYVDLFDKFVDPDLWGELKQHGIPVDSYAEWSRDRARTSGQDWITAQIAMYLLSKHQPDLLMLHLLLPDAWQHEYGIRTPEAHYAIAHTDMLLGRIITHLDETGLRDTTNLVVFADHGHAATEFEVKPNLLFQQRGWQKSGESMTLRDPSQTVHISPETRAVCISNGGDGLLYLFEDDPDAKAALSAEVHDALMATGAVDAIHAKPDFHGLGMPTDHKDSPDFLVSCKPGYYINYMTDGEDIITPPHYKSMHGYRPDMPEMDGFLVIQGPDYASGHVLEQAHTTDIAPTIAKTLGLNLPDTDGQVLPGTLDK